MRKPNKRLEKKYISSLVVAAFLALSVLTANNIRMGEKTGKESSTETKETLSRGNGSKDDESAGQSPDYDRSFSGGQDQEDDQKEEVTGKLPRSQETEPEQGNLSERGKENQSEKEGNTEESDESDNDSRQEKSDRDENRRLKEYSYDGKSKLAWPVLGNVILPYSMDTTVYYTTLDQYATNDGILIAAKSGTKVKAACDGRIVDIARTDRYGTVVTMMIGKYYETFYGQMNNVKYRIGDEVKEGEVIGTVAEPSRSFMLEGPHLYFKMTYRGKSINPADYLK